MKHINALESVQRKFTKRLQGLSELPYHQRLQALKLDSLYVRRVRQSLITAYKIVFGLLSVDRNNFFRLSDPDCKHSTRGHNYKLAVTRAHLDLHKHSFSLRTVTVWNNLPESVNFSSLTAVKKSILPLTFDDSYTCNFNQTNLFA